MFKRLREILFGEIVPPLYVPEIKYPIQGNGGGSTHTIVIQCNGGGGSGGLEGNPVFGKRVPLPDFYTVDPTTVVFKAKEGGLSYVMPNEGHYVLVPVEPSDEMIEAFYDSYEPPTDIRAEFIERYKDMIKAKP